MYQDKRFNPNYVFESMGQYSHGGGNVSAMIFEAYFSDLDKKNKYHYEDCTLIVSEYDQTGINSLSYDDFLNIFRPRSATA